MSWTQHLVSTDRGVFEVFTAGEGNPICVTHYYSAFMQRGNYFADQFISCGTVILVNLEDCGNSDKAKDEFEFDMNETVDDLEAIRSALGYTKWTFAGHSTGGMLGLVYAIRYGGFLNKLVVAGAAASNNYMESRQSIYSRKNPRNARLLEIFSILQSTESSLEVKVQAGREWTEMSLHYPEKWDEYFNKPSSGKTIQSRLDYYNKILPSFDIRATLYKIETPTLILCGKFDAQCPLDSSAEIQQLIRGSRLHIFEESNHCPHIEEPMLFKSVINYFLN
ncbi:alpha/beta fold hydrolase [Paenibacillus albus]|uniref:Alpha/beta fold hydrolase n=1 Tax=Paenibacillus albus TaxID=2495582 RepID=A0A3S9A2F2_9BACL|nr:alpha/beta fold hydrolase [Paenibacillus albus]AZN39923.1 alpha/beta fold hydrolase [Paenibacillus albus]